MSAATITGFQAFSRKVHQGRFLALGLGQLFFLALISATAYGTGIRAVWIFTTGLFLYFSSLWIYALVSLHLKTESWVNRLKQDAEYSPFFGEFRKPERIEIPRGALLTWLEEIDDTRQLPDYMVDKYFEKIHIRYGEFHRAGIMPLSDSTLEEDYLKAREGLSN